MYIYKFIFFSELSSSNSSRPTLQAGASSRFCQSIHPAAYLKALLGVRTSHSLAWIKSHRIGEILWVTLYVAQMTMTRISLAIQPALDLTVLILLLNWAMPSSKGTRSRQRRRSLKWFQIATLNSQTLILPCRKWSCPNLCCRKCLTRRIMSHPGLTCLHLHLKPPPIEEWNSLKRLPKWTWIGCLNRRVVAVKMSAQCRKCGHDSPW